jgi:hypothetical protein
MYRKLPSFLTETAPKKKREKVLLCDVDQEATLL